MIVLLAIGLAGHAASAAEQSQVPRTGAEGVGPHVLTLVDGQQTRGEVLFQHPNVERLIVRSGANRTVQSFPLSLLHMVTIDGETETYNPRRELTEAEKTTLERDGIWGDEAGPGQVGLYATEQWETRPLAVWRHPGTSGDVWESSNWLDENGEPFEEGGPFFLLPEDQRQSGDDLGIDRRFTGDVLLPASDTRYDVIQPGNPDAYGEGAPVASEMRHLTVEAGAQTRVRMVIRGNIWMKNDSMIHAWVTMVLGSGDMNKHTFNRYCNYWYLPEPYWPYASIIGHLLFVDAGPTGSLEVIGYSGGAADRFDLISGTLVMSKDSYMGCGGRSSYTSARGTTTVMLDDARLGNSSPIKSDQQNASYAIGGTLMFGTPERPLTRDLLFGGTWYKEEWINPDRAEAHNRTRGASFVLGEHGRMVIHSADPTTARVVFRGWPKDQGGGGLPGNLRQFRRETNVDWDQRISLPPDPAMWESPDAPDGVAAVFLGETDFNGVVFDNFLKGGLVVRPGAPRRWRNVSFGENNHDAPEELIRYWEKVDDD
ncbi:MAG: hypothetical protein WDZ31_09825 [Phycisphaeraceae bacterium]